MAATTKGPVTRRTRYTEVVTPTLTEAVETYVVHSIAGNSEAILSDAIASAKTNNMTAVVNGRTLNYFSATATSLGQDGESAWVQIRYRATQSAVDLVRTAKEQVRVFGSTMSLEWWSGTDAVDDLDRPNGRLRFQPQVLLVGQSGTPRPWSWQFGTQVYMLSTVLTDARWQPAEDPPTEKLAKKIGRVNSNTVDWVTKGFTFPVKTLLFRGFRAEPLLDGNWLIRYLFVYNPFTWQQEVPPAFIAGSAGIFAWVNINHYVDLFQGAAMVVNINGAGASGFIVHA